MSFISCKQESAKGCHGGIIGEVGSFEQKENSLCNVELVVMLSSQDYILPPSRPVVS